MNYGGRLFEASLVDRQILLTVSGRPRIPNSSRLASAAAPAAADTAYTSVTAMRRRASPCIALRRSAWQHRVYIEAAASGGPAPEGASCQNRSLMASNARTCTCMHADAWHLDKRGPCTRQQKGGLLRV